MKHEFRSELDDGEGMGPMKRRQKELDKERRKQVTRSPSIHPPPFLSLEPYDV